jgi:hypothetical protein
LSNETEEINELITKKLFCAKFHILKQENILIFYDRSIFEKNTLNNVMRDFCLVFQKDKNTNFYHLFKCFKNTNSMVEIHMTTSEQPRNRETEQLNFH